MSKAPELVIRGGKRSGKSVAAMMEFTSRVLGIPLHGPDGPIDLKYERLISTPDDPLQFWMIGWDTTHAATLYRLLFMPGMGGTLRCIKDVETGEWRLWNRANPEDAERFQESELCEPLIPQRYWIGSEDETFAWSEKKSYEWHSFKLSNGAMCYYWPSSAKSPKQGEAVSGILIDEDIQFAGHLREWQDRLTDKKGWFMWSVWPHMENEALLGLEDRAILDEEKDEPQIQFHQLIMSQNPFLEKEAIEQSLNRMATPEEQASRDRGEMDRGTFKMYEFSSYHNRLLTNQEDPTQVLEEGTARWLLVKILSENNYQLPADWTRYLSIDPSNTRTACHSFVVPPVELDNIYIGNIAIIEWELVVRKYSAKMLAPALAPMMGTRNYEAFIMDQQIGKQTNVGRDETVFAVYHDAFEASGLSSRLTHSWFIPGCKVPITRQRAVREMLAINSDTGIPSLMLVSSRTEATQKEFAKFRKKIIKSPGGQIITDQAANPIDFDCMSSTEYGCAHILPLMKAGQAYQSPDVYGAKIPPIVERVNQIKKRMQNRGNSFVNLGPAAPLV